MNHKFIYLILILTLSGCSSPNHTNQNTISVVSKQKTSIVTQDSLSVVNLEPIIVHPSPVQIKQESD